MKVLIAEDNADDRRLLKLSLERRGCKVIEAADGKKGLELAKQHAPDLIIADALMPVMDGYQFLRAIKQDDQLKSIPFIFYSAIYTGHEEARLAISLGAEAFIIKPKEPEEFWEEIRDLLEGCKLKNENKLTAKLIEEEEEFLSKYTHIVARNLEKKVRELQDAKGVIEAKEHEWQTTFDAIGDCVTIHDKDFNIILANKGCEDLLGISLSEISAKKCFELFHGRTEPHTACPRVRTEKSGKPSEAEFFEPVLNRWLSVSCFPVFDSNGDVSNVVHFARDITQRKRDEEQLQVFRNLVDHISDALFVIDPPSGRILDMNEQAYTSLGYSREELFEKRIIDIEALIPTDEGWQAHVEELKKSGAMNLEGTHIRKDQSTFPVEISVRYITLSNTDYMVAVVRDVSIRKKYEEEHKKLEDQLRHSQKMEAIGQLAGGVAHDFNNILTAIIGYASLTQMKMGDDDPLRPNIDQIINASQRAAVLTQSLLAFSRKQVVNLARIDLNKLITGFEKFLARLLREDIELKINCTEETMPVMADSSQIEQVLMNLVTNARDAMPDGGRLTFETKRMSLSEEFVEVHGYGVRGDYALITVSDTGAGMDEATREKIFDPFFTTKEEGKGTGLGLALVYGIVKQHNGFINVYSEPGQGTTFRIYLPIAGRTAAVAEKVETELTAIRGGTETIMIAEDDPALRKLTSTVLTHYGYRIIETVDGEDAIRKFTENKDDIQLVILDGIMPKKNGKQAYDAIKLIRPDVRAMFMSGYSEDVFSAKSIMEEGLTYILKPITPSDLVRKVREVLDKGSE